MMDASRAIAADRKQGEDGSGRETVELSDGDRLRGARQFLERRAALPSEGLPLEIRDSWARCLAAGLDPDRSPEIETVDASVLDEARERYAPLHRQALIEMHNLYRQIAGTNFMVALATPEGLLLETLGDSSFGETGEGTAIRPGTLWAEARCGTNALGTSALLGRAITVHGDEHFFRHHTGLSCSSVPIHHPDGSLAGLLDASSDCRSRQSHTRSLVTMAAMQIENGLFRHRHRRDRLISFHSRGEYLHTLSAGLLAVDEAGVILAVNGQARFLLQGLPAIPGRRLDEVFATRMGTIMCCDHEHHLLDDRVGSTFVALIENGRPAATASAVRCTPGAVGPRRDRPMPAGSPAFVAEDPALRTLVRRVEAAAARRLPILIRGETGTGKEQLARHAHAAAGRRGAVVAVNCAALSDGLIEAELFGHAEGAFTGARRGGAPGLVAEADGGTLFLDEIGDMPPALQAVLLRLLDDWTIRPVGGGRSRRVDVLLVAATNADLERAIAQGRFRADLYYRLNTVEITLPPLAARRDFEAIAVALLAAIDPDARLTAGAVGRLAARPWPGNIRELRSMLFRLNLADPGAPIDETAVAALTGETPAVAAAPATDPPAAPAHLRDLMVDRVRTIHRQTGGNVSETARRLGVSRNTVYRALGREPDRG
jgi:transcriptional regulator of acetoin/glycerol metabolism